MKTLPQFPKKRPLEREDKALFDGLFKKYPPVVSEFTFTNLFAWRHAYRFCVAECEGFVLVMAFKDDSCLAFDPIGPEGKKGDIVTKVFSSRPNDLPFKFARLPLKTSASFKDAGGFTVKEDRDNFDYVYLTRDLIDLKGKGFDGKRNFIKRFKEEHAYKYVPLTDDNVKECLSFQEEWCLAKDCQHVEGLIKEKEAMQEMLTNFQYLGMAGGMIEVRGKVEAVTLGEPLNPETFVVHIEKANGALIGIYQAVSQEFCAREAAAYRYVNREQDLGVLGLRKSKESYHPHHMVEKFVLIKN